MRTFRRSDLPRYKAVREEKAGFGQWDTISCTVLGKWATLQAAREAYAGKRLDYGLGFFADADTLSAGWTRGGLIEVSFQARGLFGEKFKAVESSAPVTYSLENIAHAWTGSGIPNPAPKLEYTYIKPVLDVVAAWKPGGAYTIDYTKQGKPISGTHWAVIKAGLAGMPAVGSNPHTAGDFTWHYPYDWSFEIIPGDSLGSGSNRLSLATFRFTHQWVKTH